MLYCAKFYGGGFGRVYEPKTPVIKLCTVQHYPIIIQLLLLVNWLELRVFKFEDLCFVLVLFVLI